MAEHIRLAHPGYRPCPEDIGAELPIELVRAMCISIEEQRGMKIPEGHIVNMAFPDAPVGLTAGNVKGSGRRKQPAQKKKTTTR